MTGSKVTATRYLPRVEERVEPVRGTAGRGGSRSGSSSRGRPRSCAASSGFRTPESSNFRNTSAPRLVDPQERDHWPRRLSGRGVGRPSRRPTRSEQEPKGPPRPVVSAPRADSRRGGGPGSGRGGARSGWRGAATAAGSARGDCSAASRARTNSTWRACPALLAWMRPVRGRPSRERSPRRSRILCRTNSSRKRSGPERMPVSSSTTAFCSDPPRARPRARSCLDFRAKPNVRAGAMRAAYSSGRTLQVRLWLPDVRMREVDLVGDRQAVAVGHVEDRLVAALDGELAVERRQAHRGVLALEARGVEESDERQRRAVQDRDLRALDLDPAVVEPLAGGGREQVLHGADRDPVGRKRGGVVEGGGGSDARRDRRLGPVDADEDEAGVGRRRHEVRRHRVARVEADPFDRNPCFQCGLRLESCLRSARLLRIIQCQGWTSEERIPEVFHFRTLHFAE